MKKRHLTVMPGVLLALLLTGLLIACPGTTDPDPVAVESVSIDGGDTDAIVGTNETLTATVLPETATNQTVTWESSVPTVATIDSASGEVTPLTAGTTVITVTTTDGSLQEDSITLTVSTTNVAVTGVIIVQGATASVTMVETLGLTATVSPETATDSSVTWESGSETVATIDSDGVVTPLTEGTTVITVTTNGVNSGGTQESADITITVTKEAITGLLIYSNITTTSGTEATASPTWDPVLGDQTVIYTIDPVLPSGITMADGVVTVGVDATVAPAATYAVTATGTGNYEGTITANIVITVNIPPGTLLAADDATSPAGTVVTAAGLVTTSSITGSDTDSYLFYADITMGGTVGTEDSHEILLDVAGLKGLSIYINADAPHLGLIAGPTQTSWVKLMAGGFTPVANTGYAIFIEIAADGSVQFYAGEKNGDQLPQSMELITGIVGTNSEDTAQDSTLGDLTWNGANSSAWGGVGGSSDSKISNYGTAIPFSGTINEARTYKNISINDVWTNGDSSNPAP